ncbi:hypothetical protein [Lapidilactobacillus wuchangensis]|uniref:hypothetical protein n=1 Tax=Lapidilactobacillus wuchangensis TaxID=2486001 RepID=UPI000F78669C|nr:hypothetical protein [Lapidilactobacillus wuchangensis]
MKQLVKTTADILLAFVYYLFVLGSLIYTTKVPFSTDLVVGTIIGALLIAGLIYWLISYLRQKLTAADLKQFLRHRRQDCKIIYLSILSLMLLLLWARLIPASTNIYFIYGAGLFLLTWFVIDLEQSING